VHVKQIESHARFLLSLLSLISGLRQEEWQFPAQILPLVSETIAQAGFSIVKVRDAL
jgi:hypothetical protein